MNEKAFDANKELMMENSNLKEANKNLRYRLRTPYTAFTLLMPVYDAMRVYDAKHGFLLSFEVHTLFLPLVSYFSPLLHRVTNWSI